MGGNLEVVCLMQAAEIERLNIYLADLQHKYKEHERSKLDRHSYEFQIKELTEKVNEAGQLKTDNEKLR
jgi:cell shape-determining protein MreC